MVYTVESCVTTHFTQYLPSLPVHMIFSNNKWENEQLDICRVPIGPQVTNVSADRLVWSFGANRSAGCQCVRGQYGGRLKMFGVTNNVRSTPLIRICMEQ